jgi:hypothetical protein
MGLGDNIFDTKSFACAEIDFHSTVSNWKIEKIATITKEKSVNKRFSV